MKFIELTGIHGERLFQNVDDISAVNASEFSLEMGGERFPCSLITRKGGGPGCFKSVKEAVEQIMEMIAHS